MAQHDINLSDDAAEFCVILSFLDDKNLAILHQTLLTAETEQHDTLLRLRPHTDNYSTLYNVYSARVLVAEPNHYVEKEIIKRFITVILPSVHSPSV